MIERKVMKALFLESFGQPLVLKEVPIPEPKHGEILVQIHASPINPSDIAYMAGHYKHDQPLPVIPGFEGAGRVIRSGGGLLGWSLVGKKVAVAIRGG